MQGFRVVAFETLYEMIRLAVTSIEVEHTFPEDQ